MTQKVIDRILMLAQERGMNQSQLAAALNLNPQNITNWKARGFPPRELERAAHALGCSVDYLLGRELKKSETQEASESETVTILAANLNRLMKVHGLANRRLSQASGVAEGSIQRMRRGDGGATVVTVERLARYFQLEPWQLLLKDLRLDSKPRPASMPAEERALYESFKRFVREARKL